MTATFNELSGSDCCGTDCCFKIQTTGCAAGVPYAQLSLVTASGNSISWLNLDTGDMVSVKPTGFVTGDCADAGINLQTCYQIGADKYSVFMVNGVTTYFKNDVLVTGAANIDAAALAVAGATYENIVSCEPAQVNPDNAVCYEKTVTTPPTPGSDVFTVQSDFPAKVAQDGTGTLLETVYTQTYTSGNEADGQYSMRNGANDRSGSNSSYAMAFNFGIGTPPVPFKFYSQKLIGTPGATYSAGYWAKDRSGNMANFRMDVLDGASVIATGTSGAMNSTYTNRRTSTFVMPAAGFVMVEIYNLVNGNASGNDPLLDGIGLGQTTAEIPGTTTTTTYRKITSEGGVDTYYDENGAEVTGAALTALLAAIAAGEYEVVPCGAGCGCTAEDLISTDAGNSLIEGTDGKLYVAATALFDDDQVLTGDNTTNTTVTLTPTTIVDPENPDVSQVNYVIKAEVKIDGTTIVQDPVTKVLSAVPQDILWDDVTTAPAATGNPAGPRFELMPDGSIYFVDSDGRAEKFKGGGTTRHEVETFVATAGQTVFTLAHTATDDVDFNRNGASIVDAAATVSGAAVTYVPAQNFNSAMMAGDLVTISYTWEDTTTVPPSGAVVTGLTLTDPSTLNVSYSDGSTTTLTLLDTFE